MPWAQVSPSWHAPASASQATAWQAALRQTRSNPQTVPRQPPGSATQVPPAQRSARSQSASAAHETTSQLPARQTWLPEQLTEAQASVCTRHTPPAPQRSSAGQPASALQPSTSQLPVRQTVDSGQTVPLHGSLCVRHNPVGSQFSPGPQPASCWHPVTVQSPLRHTVPAGQARVLHGFDAGKQTPAEAQCSLAAQSESEVQLQSPCWQGGRVQARPQVPQFWLSVWRLAWPEAGSHAPNEPSGLQDSAQVEPRTPQAMGADPGLQAQPSRPRRRNCRPCRCSARRRQGGRWHRSRRSRPGRWKTRRGRRRRRSG
jgi:hypothetical protein